MTDFDVVVVGAGASGLWAAVSAAREGAGTLVLDRVSEVGERIVCAEGVDCEGLRSLVGVRPEWVASAIGAARLYTPDGACTEVRVPGAGYVIHKDVFLRDLAATARDLGVEVMLATEVLGARAAAGGGLSVEVSTGAGRSAITCGAVVAADGIESSIGRCLGLVGALKTAELFACAQDTVSPIDIDEDAVEIHFGRSVAPGGYAWVFPKGAGTANVGVGVAPGDGNCRRTAAEFLARFKQARCPRAKVLRSIVGGVPSARNPFKACGRGAFLAGDAARVADPVSGAGIVQGMISGGAAARHACAYARGEAEPARVERAFTRVMRSHFGGRALRWAVRRAFARMSDKDLATMVRLLGEYRRRAASTFDDPVALARFLAAAMPSAFKLTRHVAGV